VKPITCKIWVSTKIFTQRTRAPRISAEKRNWLTKLKRINKNLSLKPRLIRLFVRKLLCLNSVAIVVIALLLEGLFGTNLFIIWTLSKPCMRLAKVKKARNSARLAESRVFLGLSLMRAYSVIKHCRMTSVKCVQTSSR